MLRRSRYPLLFALLLSACASPGGADRQVATDVREEAASRDEGWRAEDLPKVELSADLLLRFLVGDIAMQRGQPALAAQGWLEAARRTRDPRAARRAAELSLATGQMAQAQEATRIWAETAPEAKSARLLQMSLSIRANQLGEVEAQIPAFLQIPQHDLAGFYLQLHLLWDRSADRDTIERLTLALTAGMNNLPEAHFARAVMHATRERGDAALAELDESLRLRPWWEQAVLYKAQLLGLRVPPDPAFAWLRLAAEKNPMQISYPLTLARMLNEAQRTGEARAAYEAVLVRQPDMLEALVGAGVLALQQRDLEGAYQMLSAAEQHAPANADLLRYYLGQIDEERNRVREALDWYRRVGGDEKGKAALRMPRLLAKLGQRDVALQALAGLPAGNDDEKIQKAQIEAQVWRELKEYGKARAVLDQAISRHPDADDLYYDRSLIADQLDDLPAAEADLRRMLQKQPGSAVALNALGYMLANRTERLAEAEKLLEQAIASDPDNPVIIDSIGWLRFRQGRLQEAVEWLGRAYRVIADPEVAAHYSEALWRSGDKERAREVLDAALKADPAHEVAQETRKRLGY